MLEWVLNVGERVKLEELARPRQVLPTSVQVELKVLELPL